MHAHTVSKFYLGGFTDQDPSSSGYGRVWVRAAADPTWMPQRTEDTAWVADYYASDGEVSTPNEGLEGALGDIETQAGVAFRKLKAAVPDFEDIEAASIGPRLSKRTRVSLAGFVVSTALRVPPFHEKLEPHMPEIMRSGLDALYQEFIQYPERLTDEIRQYEETTGQDDFRGLVPDDFRVESVPDVTRPLVVYLVLRKQFLPLTLALANETEWIFWVARGRDSFITSDNPAASVVTLRGPRPEVVFPLTRSIALLATGQTSAPGTARWRPARTRLVGEINLRTAASSKLWIASERTFPPTALSSHVIPG
jgi:hypothetical protein